MEAPPQPRSFDPRTAGVVAGAVVGVVVVLLVVAQLVLPGVAENKVKDQIKGFGTDPDVKVKAFPAVKLLFGKADKVDVSMPSARAQGSAALADQLERTKDVDEIHVRVGRLQAGPLVVRDARLDKDSGGALSTSATVRNADLARAVPPILQDIRVAADQSGGGLVLQGVVEAPIVGRIRASARVQAIGGEIVARPEGLPILDQILSLTIFSDPRVAVQSVGAKPRAGGFDLAASGQVQ